MREGRICIDFPGLRKFWYPLNKNRDKLRKLALGRDHVARTRFEIHMHSNRSDGEFSPSELVSIAKRNKVSLLSLTDHDTFSGVDELVASAEGEDIIAFPGIEMTVRYRDFNLHLLSYFKEPAAIQPALRERVEKMKQDREDRMHELIARINEVVPDRFQGSITFENVKKGSEGVLARPHLAREMVRLGIVSDSRQAFDIYLVKYNVEKDNLDIYEALEMVQDSNGIPVLAHPGERTYSLCNPDKGRPLSDVPEMVRDLKAYGLMGLECVYPYHEKTGQVDFFLNLTEEFGLIATGSRDFHGFTTHQTPDVLGTTKMDADWFDRFQQAWG